MDQRGSTYSKRRMAIFEPGRGELHAEPHVRPISCHVLFVLKRDVKLQLTILPCRITIAARTGRGIEQTSSDDVKVKMLVVLKY